MTVVAIALFQCVMCFWSFLCLIAVNSFCFVLAALGAK